MRHIIGFGYASYSSSYGSGGDKLLAAEPLRDMYPEIEEAGTAFFQLDPIAISGHDGYMDIRFNPNDLEHSCTHGEFYEEVCRIKRVRCLTLDTWISRYADQGFTERIDILNCVVNGNAADPIFEAFSFNPQPEFIMIRQPEFPEKSIKRMERHGYRIYLCGGAVMGVKC